MPFHRTFDVLWKELEVITVFSKYNMLMQKMFVKLFLKNFFDLYFQVEDNLFRQQMDENRRNLQEFDDRQRHYQEQQRREEQRRLAEAEVVQALLNFSEERKS